MGSQISFNGLWTISVVILVNVHLAMDINQWALVSHVAVWGSIIITYGCMVILDSIPVFPNYGLVMCDVCLPMNILYCRLVV